MHRSRMKNIAMHLVPSRGTPEWNQHLERIKPFLGNKDANKYLKKIFEEANSTCFVQDINGARLPADKLLREFNREYNSRSLNGKLDSLPSSFNVVEAFNKFETKSAVFRIYPEVDCLFSFENFLDYVTSSDCPEDWASIEEKIPEGEVFSFNSIDDPSRIMFSAENNDEFGILSVSMIRHGNEVSVVMQAGQKCDLEIKSNELKKNNYDFGKFNNRVTPDESLEIEAVPLLPGSKLWRTIILCRFDLQSTTLDARYVLSDAGRSFSILTDDLDSFHDMRGTFYSEEAEAIYKTQSVEIEKYTSLFNLCKTSLYLPYFREEFEDTISIERHPTEFGEKRNQSRIDKAAKWADKKLKLGFRNVENIVPSNRNMPSRREFLAPELKYQTSGYWKSIDFQTIGEDKNKQPIHGRTWVNKTLEWKEGVRDSDSVRAVSSTSNSNSNGYIYVMRTAAHGKNVFKVGLTTRTSEERSVELSRSTSSIDHFHVVEEWDVEDCRLAEKLIHEKLDEYRINPNREFFNAPYKVIFKAIDEIINSMKTR